MKNQILGFLLVPLSFSCYAQNKADIGLTTSSYDLESVGIEYRYSVGDKYKLRASINYGDRSYDSSVGPFREVLSASDSLIVYQNHGSFTRNWQLRIGAQRQLKSSVFSLGGDLGFAYQAVNIYEFVSPTILNEDNEWEDGIFVEAGQFNNGSVFTLNPALIGDNLYKGAEHSLLMTNLRLSINADIPLGRAFIFHFSLANSLNVPIYLGVKDKFGALGEEVTKPNLSLKMNQAAVIGLRYNFGPLFIKD